MAYIWNENRHASGKPTCDEGCRASVYCDIVATETFEENECNGKPDFDFKHDPLNSIMNWLLNPWIKKS